MKKEERVTLHRERLHKEVWQTPIRQLAKKYGMSDVGLAKVCRKMNIPTPPRGYWAKRQYGHEVETQPRLAAKKNAPQTAAIDKSAEELLHMARNRASGSKVRHAQRQRIHRLQNELRDWEAGNRIRAFIAAMRASGRATAPEQAEFLAWAETYANHLDPTVDFRIEALEE